MAIVAGSSHDVILGLPFAQQLAAQLDTMSSVHDTIQNGIGQGGIAEHMEMPRRLTGKSLRSESLTRVILCTATAFRSLIGGRDAVFG